MRAVVEFIHRIVTGERHIRILLTPVFAVFFLCLIALLIFLALRVDAFFSLSSPLEYPWNYIASILLLAGGGFLSLWSVLHFAKARGTPVPTSPPAILVDSGPYAYVRNPMLAGVFLMLFGVAFLIGSSSLLFCFAPAFVVCSVLEFKLIEEPELEKRFGEKYMDYKRRTPLLVPRFSRQLSHGAGIPKHLAKLKKIKGRKD
ncbi:MAG: isoprenylcysteine carboxylmethyltransferase family protein [Syntrophales bacterium]|nr:isoprenylcysteine carboxylmethyltransferase family protein [Syntrophales bacterium]